jgi:DNA-binding response OmpR family regulator
MITWKTEIDTTPLNTVLIISENQSNVEVWETLFSQRNCIVLSEANTPNALQSARLVGPSLMLVDMKLSRSERGSLLAGLRTASRGPILMLIDAHSVSEIVEANHEGVDECLVKPVNPAILVIKAMAWLNHGQRSERAPALLGATS